MAEFWEEQGWKTLEALIVRKLRNRATRLEHLIESEAPDVIIAGERRLLHKAINEWLALGGEEDV